MSKYTMNRYLKKTATDRTCGGGESSAIRRNFRFAGTFPFARGCLAVAGVALLVGSLGCGTKQYEQRVSNQVRQLKEGSVFREMYPPQAVPGTSVSFRLPRILGESPLPENTDPVRLKPPEEIKLPGQSVTYEGLVQDSEGGKIPFYCYLAVQDKSTGKTINARLSFRLALRGLFPGTSAEWQPVNCPTPDGRTVPWKKIQASGDQEFVYVNKDGQGSVTKMAGTIECYLWREGDLTVSVVWRVPTSIEEYIELSKWAPTVAGSMTVN
jgi:hypothetical protein